MAKRKPPPPRADDWAEEAPTVAAGSVSHGVEDPLGTALLDALAAVAKARVHLAESTAEECSAVATRLDLLRSEVASLPIVRPRAPIGFGPGDSGVVTSRRRARELRDRPVK